MIKAVIFDFDGVIVDTESLKFEEMTKSLTNNKYRLDSINFKNFVGKKRTHFLEEHFPTMSKKQQNHLTNNLRELDNINVKKYKLIKGIKTLLSFLTSKEYTIAITTGSNNTFVQNILKFHSLEKYFEVIVSGNDFSQSKPHPECYLITLNKLNLNPAEVIIIEDSIAGVKAAKDANCKVIGLLSYLSKEDLRNADDCYYNHNEIKNYFQSL